MIFVRFRLGPFASVDSSVLMDYDRATRTSPSQSLTAAGKKLLGLSREFDLANQLPESWYFRRTTYDPELNWDGRSDESGFASSWASLAALLLDEPNLSGVPMFHIMGFQKESGKYVQAGKFSTFSSSSAKTNGFSLVEGDRYRLRVLQWREPPPRSKLVAARVVTEFDKNIVRLEGSSNLVLGRYDVLEFPFLGLHPGYSELAIQTDLETGVDDKKTKKETTQDPSATVETQLKSWPTIFTARVPVSVRHNWRRVGGVIAAGIIGIGLYIFGPRIAPDQEEVLQLIGLSLAFFSIGEHLERFAKLRENVGKATKQDL